MIKVNVMRKILPLAIITMSLAVACSKDKDDKPNNENIIFGDDSKHYQRTRKRQHQTGG